MEFTSSVFTMLIKDMERTLRPLEEKYGIKFECNKLHYTENDFKTQVRAYRYDDEVNGEREIFIKNCPYYGFEVDDYRRRFYIKDVEYELIGFFIRAEKKPCKLRRISDKKLCKASIKAVMRGFGRDIY